LSAGVELLAGRLGSLQWLDLNSALLDPAGLPPLAGRAPALAHLALPAYRLTAESVAALARLPALRSLSLYGRVVPAVAAALPGSGLLGRLESLCLSYTG